MGRHCAALGCSNSDEKNKKEGLGLTFHAFPINRPSALKAWEHAVKRQGFKATAYSVLCSDHFTSDDFRIQNFTGTRFIKKTAVPSKFVSKEDKTITPRQLRWYTDPRRSDVKEIKMRVNLTSLGEEPEEDEATVDLVMACWPSARKGKPQHEKDQEKTDEATDSVTNNTMRGTKTAALSSDMSTQNKRKRRKPRKSSSGQSQKKLKRGKDERNPESSTDSTSEGNEKEEESSLCLEAESIKESTSVLKPVATETLTSGNDLPSTAGDLHQKSDMKKREASDATQENSFINLSTKPADIKSSQPLQVTSNSAAQDTITKSFNPQENEFKSSEGTAVPVLSTSCTYPSPVLKLIASNSNKTSNSKQPFLLRPVGTASNVKTLLTAGVSVTPKINLAANTLTIPVMGTPTEKIGGATFGISKSVVVNQPSMTLLSTNKLQPPNFTTSVVKKMKKIVPAESQLGVKISELNTHQQGLGPSEKITSPECKGLTVNTFPCIVCGNVSPSLTQLNEHMSQHRMVSMNPQHTQQLCGKSFHQAKQLAGHSLSHEAQSGISHSEPSRTANKNIFILPKPSDNLPVKAGVCKCDVCGREFLNEINMQDHRAVMHRDQRKNLSCTVCGKVYKMPYQLRAHQRTHHEFQTMVTSNLEDPTTVNINSESPAKINIKPPESHTKVITNCKRRTKVKTNAKCHTKSRTNLEGLDKVTAIEANTKFECTICKKSLSSLSRLHRHLGKHKAGKLHFPCDVCGKIFVKRSRLRNHQVAHSDQRNYKCDVCGKAFKRLKNFQNHQLYHRGLQRKFQCHICGKHMTSRDGLKGHLLAHEGPAPFKCTLCDKGYYSSCNLRLHQKSKHGYSIS